MGHVILAWGTSLMAVLIVMLVLYGIFSKKGDEQSISERGIGNFLPICDRQPDQPVDALPDRRKLFHASVFYADSGGMPGDGVF